MTEHYENLRAHVHGNYPLEAGTEMLIRAFGGRFAEPGNPWIKEDPRAKEKPWIDFGEIANHVGALSGGEGRFLMLAASVAVDVPVSLGEILAHLDRALLEIAMAAFSHASGSHQDCGDRFSDDGLSIVRGERPGPLYPWPAEPNP